jgi:hypothetical protein
MEAEGSLPRSQEPFTCPYPEPDQLIPYHPIPVSLKINVKSREITSLNGKIRYYGYPYLSLQKSDKSYANIFINIY